MDRLEEIKAQPSTEYLDPAEKAWLIAEVERLRATNYTTKIADAAEALRGYRDIEIAALRGALQALVNSTEATYYGISEYKAATAAAVALLAGPTEDERTIAEVEDDGDQG